MKFGPSFICRNDDFGRILLFGQQLNGYITHNDVPGWKFRRAAEGGVLQDVGHTRRVRGRGPEIYTRNQAKDKNELFNEDNKKRQLGNE